MAQRSSYVSKRAGTSRHMGTKEGFKRFETSEGFGAAGTVAVYPMRPPTTTTRMGRPGKTLCHTPTPGVDNAPASLRVRLHPAAAMAQGFGRANQGPFLRGAPRWPLTRGDGVEQFGVSKNRPTTRHWGGERVRRWVAYPHPSHADGSGKGVSSHVVDNAASQVLRER